MEQSQERTWAMFCHLGALSGYIIPFGHIIVPLILFLIKKDESAFVAENGKASLNFQISLTIYALISALLIFIFIGVIGLIVIGIVDIVNVIIAGIKANKGEVHEYPFSIEFIK
jgi:hypothetical protein